MNLTYFYPLLVSWKFQLNQAIIEGGVGRIYFVLLYRAKYFSSYNNMYSEICPQNMVIAALGTGAVKLSAGLWSVKM